MTMLKLSLRSIRANLGRLALTGMAVVFGVGFVSGSFIIADSLRDTFGSIVANANAGIDARVQLADVDDFGAEVTGVPEEILADIEALDEVDRAVGFVALEEFRPFIALDAEGETVEPQGPPILTFSWTDDPDFAGGFELVDGTAPSGPDSVALDADYVDALGAEVGQTIEFLTPTGEQSFRLDGIVSFEGAAGAFFVLFDLETAQAQYGLEGLLSQISIAAAPGVTESEVVDAIEPLLPAGVEAIEASVAVEQDTADFNQIIDFIGWALLGFALVALFVSLFIIYNTFAILVSQRTREIGMLRAIGASRDQLLLSIVIEALVVGVVASALGVFAGIGVAELIQTLFTQAGGGFPDTGTAITVRTVVIAMVAGVLATVASSVFPAFRAARISPIAAMRNEAPPKQSLQRRILGGALVTALGALAMIFGFTGSGGVSGTLTLLGVGAVLVFIGTALLSVLFAGPVVRLLGRAPLMGVLALLGGIIVPIVGFALSLAGLFTGASGFFTQEDGEAQLNISIGSFVFVVLGIGVLALGLTLIFAGPPAVRDGFRLLGGLKRTSAPRRVFGLAIENAARSPRRTASTATALTIGLALVTMVSVMASSLKASLSDTLDDVIGADLFVFTDNGDPEALIPLEVANRVERVDGIESSTRYRIDEVRLPGGEVVDVAAWDTTTGDSLIDFELIDGAYDTGDTGVLLFDELAEAQGVGVGDSIDVEFTDLETETLTVTGLYSDNSVLESDVMVDLPVLDRHVEPAGDAFFSATIAEGADVDAVKDAANGIVAAFPSIVAQDNEEFREGIESQINQLLVLINGLLGLALVVAFLGVVNTIALSVIERTQEIGLLRAVGTTREQLGASIRFEAITVSIFGAIMGLILGFVFAAAAVTAVPDNVLSTIAVPWGTIIAVLIASACLGMTAAFFPARRAAKMPVLEAIAAS